MTTIRHTMTFLCVLLGAICIQSITATAQSDSYGWDDSGSSLLSVDIDPGFAVNSPTNFNDNLYVQLLRSNAFRSIFNEPYSADAVNNLLSCVANSIAQEFQIDANSAMNTFYSTMENIYPGSAAEVYAGTIADSLSEVLSNYNTLSTYNSFDVANTVANLFNGCAGGSYEETDYMNTEYYSGTDVVSNANLGSGLNPTDGLGAGVGAGLNPTDGLGAGVATGLRLGTGAGIGSGFGTNLGGRLGANLGSGLGGNIGAGFGTNLGGRIGANQGSGLGGNIGAGFGTNIGGRIGANLGSGLGGNIGAGVGTGLRLSAGAGLGVGAGIAVGLGAEVGGGAGLCLNGDLDVGANIAETLDLDAAVVLFQQSLKRELLKDRYFRSVFTDSIPEAAVSNIASAIAQFLSKAFKLSRSYLLNLERDLTTYIRRDLASPNEYAEGISISFVNLLASANLLVPSAICVQIGMASKAITSSIINFMGTNNVAGVGLGISSNPYNSYFSVLSGLEMLPYVGPDTVSRKYPPILKAIRATNFGAKFTQSLTSNLISSNKFSSAFLLGIPAPIWKNVARCIGNSMAEAFGSVNPAFFTDVYANALLSMGEKLSYKTYARVLSAATAKALYALGYFVSGNPNIQAAIAANAIIRTTVNRCILRYNTQFPTMTTNLGLPWMTPVAGVLPPQVDTGVDIGANVGLDVGANLDVGLDADIDARADIDANAATGVGNIPGSGRSRRDLRDAQPALGNSPDVNGNVGVVADAGAGLPSGVDVEAALDADLEVGTDLQPNLGASVELGIGANADINVGAQADVAIASILDVLPQMLAEKLYASTAMYTAMSIVGPRKVANLIGQGIAAQFGFQSAAVFSNAYDISTTNMADRNFSPSIAAIARATTEALANSGVLANGFTVLSADQLSTAIVLKYSSLIATSLDTKEWNFGRRWNYIYDQDFIAPPLSRGYNYWRPNVFSSYVGSFDDSLALDYGMGNSVTLNVPANNGIPPARSKVLLK